MNTIETTLSNFAGPIRRRPRRDVEALVEHLAAQPRFAGSSDAELAALVRAGTTISVPAHWAFMRQGEPAHDLYLLLTGSADVFDHRTPVATIAAGDIAGEIALLRGGQRTATVTSGNTLRALRLDYERLSTVMDRHPHLRAVITDVGAERLGRTA